jgi:hypothetical protein
MRHSLYTAIIGSIVLASCGQNQQQAGNGRGRAGRESRLF